MTEEVRPIDNTRFIPYMGSEKLNPDLGVKPGLTWIPISNLVIEDEYQRELFTQHAIDIGRIARQFNWSSFGCVVVCNIGDNQFAIVDGQRRTIAASLRNITEVPCVIITATLQERAEAFSAINSAVIPISPLSIFNAQLIGRDPKALKISAACKEAGVVIRKYPCAYQLMGWNETSAITSIIDVFDTCGKDILILGLKCLINASRKTRKTVLKAGIIKGLCNVLESEGTFRAPEYRLLAVMEGFDFEEEYKKAGLESKQGRKHVQQAFALRVFRHLDEALGE